MDLSEGTVLAIVERLSSAYGVITQKALAECLGVPAANISNWVQRDSVPGSAFVKCALDIGRALYWLTSGKLANANLDASSNVPKGKALYTEITSSGGKPVLCRIMDAYGFTLQKQLCEFLEISSGTVSTWVRRNYFPGDVVVTCAIDTGVCLQWLATGKGTQAGDSAKISTAMSFPHKKLTAGVLHDAGAWSNDLSFIPQALSEPIFISGSTESWIIDASMSDISNGRWLLSIDDKYDIYDITLLLGRKISVTNNSINFTCGVNEVGTPGKVALTLNYKS